MLSVDEAYMKMALAVASDGVGRVWPNPAVGCVIVNDGVVVGRGRTADGGRPHAEAAALEMAGARAKGADVYVTLEPCAERGRDESCCDKLIAAQVGRVIVACHDPNPVVCTKGIAKLEAAGIQVDFGVCEEEAIAAHQGFFLRVTDNRPFVCLKQAVSHDGMIAAGKGERTQISGHDAQVYVHTLRSTYDAIAVGVNTVLVDDPMLNVRLAGEEHSIVRVVFDSDLRTPVGSRLVQTARDEAVWVVYKSAPTAACDALEDAGVKLIQSGGCVRSALHALAEAGLTRLLVEGGARLHHSFVQSGMYDEVQIIKSPRVLGEQGVRAAEMLFDVLDLKETHALGEDLLEVYTKSG
ncbi:MAG: bifunctional diaminohydroxyphosphoribosylaminopyrimidine deaminase/5-amino-6-(5-phosphoribosylamino)uracil reductase RibD [Alphaproteobacteria bacterium]